MILDVTFRTGIGCQGVEWRRAKTNAIQPTGGVRRAGETSEIMHDSGPILYLNRQALRGEQIRRSMERPIKLKSWRRKRWNNGNVYQGDKAERGSQGGWILSPFIGKTYGMISHRNFTGMLHCGQSWIIQISLDALV